MDSVLYATKILQSIPFLVLSHLGYVDLHQLESETAELANFVATRNVTKPWLQISSVHSCLPDRNNHLSELQ